jgi:hypothetical protein
MVNVRGSDAGIAKNELVRDDEYIPGAARAVKAYQPIPAAIAHLGQTAASRKTSKLAGTSKAEEAHTWKAEPVVERNVEDDEVDGDSDTSRSLDSDVSD